MVSRGRRLASPRRDPYAAAHSEQLGRLVSSVCGAKTYHSMVDLGFGDFDAITL